MSAKELEWKDIAVGDSASFEREVREEDVVKFAEISGDRNLLHMDDRYARGTFFGGKIVHGMFLGALVSRLIGMELPGKKALLMKETLEFKKPARVGDMLTVSGTVAHKSEAGRTLEILLEIRTKKELLVSGSAYVRVL